VTKDDAIAVGAGAITATGAGILDNPFVQSGIKGLVGGIMGYLGKVAITWMIKKLKEYKQNKNQTQK
jgi:hypothetical protein